MNRQLNKITLILLMQRQVVNQSVIIKGQQEVLDELTGYHVPDGAYFEPVKPVEQ